VAGGKVEVTYIGPAKEIEYQVDGRPPVKIKPDQNGKLEIESVPAGEEFVLSDNHGLPGFLFSEIISVETRGPKK